MRTKKWFLVKGIPIVLIILVIVSVLLTATPVFATDAMKPGNGNGDTTHVHYGAPGHNK